MSQTISVTVIGGYLGAGKTTLVNHILRSGSQSTAVLVNDFGSINIDADLIVSSDDDTITLANGCICCSLIDGFGAALDSLLNRSEPPQRLIIEASGVSDPLAIAAYAQTPGLSLDSVVIVVDAETVRAKSRDRYVGDVVVHQIQAADLLVVNKTDLIGKDELAATLSWLALAAPSAALVTTVDAELPLPVLIDRPEPPGFKANETNPIEADDRFESWSLATSEPLDRSRLLSMFDQLPSSVLRLKGIVRFTDSPGTKSVVHRVGNRWEIEDDGEWPGGECRIVAIGTSGAIGDDWMSQQLEL